MLSKFGELNGGSSIESLLNIRLVCKTWKDAQSEYSGGTRMVVRRNTDLDQLCKLLPQLSGVVVDNHTPDFSFSPLSALSQLSSLRLNQMPEEEDEDEDEDEVVPTMLLDLSPLPSSLRALELLEAQVDPDCHQQLQLTSLTRLVYTWTSSSCSEAVDLMQHLPALQVLFIHIAPQ